MKLFSAYSVKIKHFHPIFKETVEIYRNAVEYLISVCNWNWDKIVVLQGKTKLTYVENLRNSGGNSRLLVSEMKARFL